MTAYTRRDGRARRDHGRAHALAVNSEHRRLERDCTPRPVIGQLIEVALDELAELGMLPRPLVAFDGWAGAGPWSSQLRLAMVKRGLPLHITAADINPAERVYMRRWADVAIIADVRRVLAAHSFDLIVANPAFSHVTPDFQNRDPDRWPPEQTPVPLMLRSAPAALILHRHDVLCRGAGGQWLAEHYPPARVWDIAGPVFFRGPGLNPENGKPWAADQYSYSGYLWVRGHRGPWAHSVLPALPVEDRRWTIRPGAEPLRLAREMGLIEAPRRKQQQ